MGIDIYAEWRGMTEEESNAQITGFDAAAGHVGYLREAYHGEPYATRVLVPEAFEQGEATIVPHLARPSSAKRPCTATRLKFSGCSTASDTSWSSVSARKPKRANRAASPRATSAMPDPTCQEVGFGGPTHPSKRFQRQHGALRLVAQIHY